MKRILFVDDEARILDGLKRMLRPQRHQWEMSFVSSGAEALAALKCGAFDVVVTDMRMPEMDGAQLLEHVRERFPQIVRIVLSGYFDADMAMRAVPVAHQFVAKPCNPAELRNVIERSCRTSAILPDDAIRRVVAAIGELPAMPNTCWRLIEALQDPYTSLAEVGGIVEQDIGITAKVLQLVNSAFFGVMHEVTSVKSAVSYLGLDTLRQLVLTVEILHAFKPGRVIAHFSLEDLQEHARLAGRIAARLPSDRKVASAAMVASFLHDAGKLVLASRLPQQFEEALCASCQQDRPLFEVEKELIGASHAEVGAYLLGIWGLPQIVVEAVWRHHNPSLTEEPGSGLNVLAATHIADALALEVAPGGATNPVRRESQLNLEYLTALGCVNQLPAWREMAAEIVRAPEI